MQFPKRCFFSNFESGRWAKSENPVSLYKYFFSNINFDPYEECCFLGCDADINWRFEGSFCLCFQVWSVKPRKEQARIKQKLECRVQRTATAHFAAEFLFVACFVHYSTLRTEAVFSSEASVHFYQTTRSNFPENNIITTAMWTSNLTLTFMILFMADTGLRLSLPLVRHGL
jgi:hypothetical protein